MSWAEDNNIDIGPTEEKEREFNIHSKNDNGGNKMEEETKTEHVSNKEIVISAVEMESSPNNPDEVKRIRFKADIGDITWKPKVDKVDYVCGIKRTSKISVTISTLPESLLNISGIVQNNGPSKFKNVSYSLMKTTDAEGTNKTYRFIMAESILKKWTHVPKEQVAAAPVVEEKVVEKSTSSSKPIMTDAEIEADLLKKDKAKLETEAQKIENAWPQNKVPDKQDIEANTEAEKLVSEIVSKRKEE